MRFFSHFRAPQTGAALVSLAALAGAVLFAGCGGGSGSSNASTARIRAFDAIANGGTATISVNGNAIRGSQTFAVGTTYQFLGNGASSAAFSLSANAATTYPAITQTFTVGSFYSLFAVGRADITSATDPRYPSLLVTADNFTNLPLGQAAVRVVQAAPDAGSVDVLVNGAAVTTGAAFKSVSSDVNVSAGTATIQVNKAGTNTILAGPQALPVTGGHVYTVLVLEPTVSPAPAYGIQGLDDTGSQ